MGFIANIAKKFCGHKKVNCCNCTEQELLAKEIKEKFKEMKDLMIKSRNFHMQVVIKSGDAAERRWIGNYKDAISMFCEILTDSKRI
jgi:hypothetical protein